MPLSFLAPAGLLAALAVAVPIAVHLLQRRREATVDFPAVRFLLLAQRRAARRLRLRRLLLLAVRCLAVLLLALALARPVLDAAGAGAGAGAATVVVLDTSLSMEAQGATRSRLDAARDYATALAGDAGEGARLALVEAAGLPPGGRATPWLDPASFLGALEESRAVPAVADPGAAFAEAYRLLAGPEGAGGRIVVVSDLARGGWEGFSLAGVPGIDARVPVRVARIGGDGAENRSGVLAVAASGASMVAGEVREVAAEVFNGGPDEALPVELWVDGQLAATRIERIPPGSAGRSVFPVRLEGGGTHRAEVRVPADRFAPDDGRRLGLEALPPVGVLVIDGEPGASLLQGETFFVQEALRPGRLATGRSVLVRVGGPGTLAQPLPPDTGVVVVANLDAPGDAAARQLAEFVAGGGGLLVFWGRLAEADSWRAVLPGVLPAQVRGVETAASAGRPFRIGDIDYDAAPLSVFRPPGGGTFATAVVGARAVLGPGGSAARVLARFADGAPWIVEQPVGRGRVVLVATAADLEWSDLPTRPVFVPLVQRLVLHLAGSLAAAADAETVAGEERVLEAGAAQAGAVVTVTTPGGEAVEVPLQPAEGGSRAVFRGTTRPGFYAWSRPGAAGVFAVNPPRGESDLAPLGEEEVAARFAPVRPELVDVVPDSGEGRVLRAGARSLERPLLLALLAVLLLESLLAAPRVRREDAGRQA